MHHNSRWSMKIEDMTTGNVCELIMREELPELPESLVNHFPRIESVMNVMKFYHATLFYHSKHLNIPDLRKSYKYISWTPKNTVNIYASYKNIITHAKKHHQFKVACYLGFHEHVKEMAEIFNFMTVARTYISHGLLYVDPFILGYYNRYLEGRPLPPKAITLLASHCVREKYYYPLKFFWKMLTRPQQQAVISQFMKLSVIGRFLTCECIKIFHFFSAKMTEAQRQTLLRKQPFETLVLISYCSSAEVFVALYRSCMRLGFLSSPDAVGICMSLSKCSCVAFKIKCPPGPDCQFQRYSLACECFRMLLNEKWYGLLSICRVLAFLYPRFFDKNFSEKGEILHTIVKSRFISEVVRQYQNFHPQLKETFERVDDGVLAKHTFMTEFCKFYEILSRNV